MGVALSTAVTDAESPCPVCDEARGITIALKDRVGRALKTTSCIRCGLMRVDPLPTDEDLRRFYELEYRSSYKGVRNPKPKHIYRAGLLASERLRRLADYLANGSRVLDIGCGSGEWLYMLNAAGHSAAGVELDPAYAEFGRREYGVDIRTGSLLALDMPDREIDCITMFHVLEHIPYPVAALRRMHHWLQDDGVLVIEVPNVNSPHQHPAKRFHYAHVVGFTPGSFGYAMKRSGWEMLECSLDRYERNIFAVVRKRLSDSPEGAPGQPEGDLRPPAPLISSPAATLGYYLQPSTYMRWIERMMQFSAEFRAIGLDRATPREILHTVRKKAGNTA